MKGSDSATLIAIGPRAVNQAVKSFTIARQYLAADPDTAFDVVARVGFGERGEEDQLESDPLCLLLSTAPRDHSPAVTTRPLRVSGASVPDRVAGAISSRVEENGAVSITAMGARSVFVAVEALALAQAALEQINLDTFCALPLPPPPPLPFSGREPAHLTRRPLPGSHFRVREHRLRRRRVRHPPQVQPLLLRRRTRGGDVGRVRRGPNTGIHTQWTPRPPLPPPATHTVESISPSMVQRFIRVARGRDVSALHGGRDPVGERAADPQPPRPAGGGASSLPGRTRGRQRTGRRVREARAGTAPPLAAFCRACASSWPLAIRHHGVASTADWPYPPSPAARLRSCEKARRGPMVNAAAAAPEGLCLYSKALHATPPPALRLWLLPQRRSCVSASASNSAKYSDPAPPPHPSHAASRASTLGCTNACPFCLRPCLLACCVGPAGRGA